MFIEDSTCSSHCILYLFGKDWKIRTILRSAQDLPPCCKQSLLRTVKHIWNVNPRPMVLHTVRYFFLSFPRFALRHKANVTISGKLYGFVPEQFLQRGKKRSTSSAKGLRVYILLKGTPLWHKYSTLFESIGMGIAAPPDFRVLYTSCNFKVLPLPAAGTVIFTYNNALILCQQYMSGI